MAQFKVVFWIEDRFDASHDRMEEMTVEACDKRAAGERVRDEHSGAIVQCVQTA